MAISELLKNDLAIALIALVAGSLLTVFISKLQSKTSTLRYTCRIDRLAVSTNDQMLGEVNVTLQGNVVRNLFVAIVEIENTTSLDFENIPFKIFTGNETILMGERTALIDSPYAIAWSDPFRLQLAVTNGATPTQEQWNIVNHSREYTIPVFNRGQKVQLTYFCTCPNTDGPPGIFVSTLYPAVKLKYQNFASLVFGVPVHLAAPRGILIALIVVAVCGVMLGNTWAAASIAAVVGLFAQAVGAWLYKAERYILRAIAG